MMVTAADYNIIVMSASDEDSASDEPTVVSLTADQVSQWNMTGQVPSAEGSPDDASPTHPSKNDPFNEKFDDIATDIIICTLVLAFVAIQYRDIIRTCHD